MKNGALPADFPFRPDSCVWEITLACCFRCAYCGSGGGKARENELTTEECLDAARQIAEIGVKRVSLIGGEVFLRPDWEEVKVGIMEEIVRAKFTQHPELAARLLATGDKVLVEGNHWGDTCWGVDTRTGQGENHLGKILMKVREELRQAWGEE